MTRRRNWIAVFAVGIMLSGSFVQADEQAVYFPTGSSQLSAKSKAALKKLAGSSGSIKLHGSSDPRGSEEVNARLREERVRSVREFLVSAGIPEAQIQSDGGAAGEGPPASWARLRKVAIEAEGAAVASAGTSAKDKRAAAAEAKRAAAEEKSKAIAEQKAAAAEQKAAAAEQKRVAAEQQRMTADQKKADNEKRRAEAEAKKAEADQKKAEAEAARAAEAEQKRLAATTPKKDPTEISDKVDKDGKHLEKINLVYWKSINHALWIIAKEKGFFEAEGFDVSLQETDADARVIAKSIGTGPNIMAGAAGAQNAKILEKGAKHFTAGAVCGFAVHEAMAHKEPIVDIGSLIMMPESMVMKKEIAEKIDKNIAAFKGLGVGAVTYGSGEHDFRYSNVLKSHLKKIGLTAGTDYTFKAYTDNDGQYRDLAANKIDIAIGLPPNDVEFLRKHPGYVRVSYAKYFPYMPCCRQIVTRSQLKNSRDKYVRLLRATIRAHQYTIQHPRETSAILGRWLNTPPDIIREAIMSTYISLNPDPMRKGVELLQRTNENITGMRASVAEYIDTSLYRDALFGLAKENDDDASKGYYDTMISRFRANN